MLGWKSRIDIVQLYDELSDEPTGREIGEAAIKIIAKLRVIAEYGFLEKAGVNSDPILNIAEDMEMELSSNNSMSMRTFDYYLGELYDWGDSARVIIGDDRYKQPEAKPRPSAQSVLGSR